MELSAKLKQIRKDNNMTQQELADVLCLSRSVIAQYEKGYKIPNITTLDAISKYFNTSIFDKYKKKVKHLFLSLKCVFPYLISFMMFLLSSLSLVCNIIKVNNEYGYNIYNDGLKVKNCAEIIIVKPIYKEGKNNLYLETAMIIYEGFNYPQKFNLTAKKDLFIYENYYLVFVNFTKNIKEGIFNSDIEIKYSPFIYALEGYNPSFPYNNQTGECRKILNYYIDLIEKTK